MKTMDESPDALRLAEKLDEYRTAPHDRKAAAAELRRLYEAHEIAVQQVDSYYRLAGDRLRRIVKLARRCDMLRYSWRLANFFGFAFAAVLGFACGVIVMILATGV